MESEAALYPPDIRLGNSLRRYALRALQLPKEHPIYKLILARAPYLSDPPLEEAPTPPNRRRGRRRTAGPQLQRTLQASRIRDSIANLQGL